VRANEKQAVFTGKQQRDGVAILPFLVAGLFGPLGDGNGSGAFEAELAAERAVVGTAMDAVDATGYDADCDEEAAKLGKEYVFDWEAYHNEWGDTPVNVAVTSMFAEYAVLCARVAGRTTSAVPPPMTMTRGLDIGQQATNFVTKFVTPILGHIASVKVHKLLCHVVDAVRWHGNLQNGNTAVNESGHKMDKSHYLRTNKDVRTFTRQLVRHAHGARGILSRHAKDDGDAAAAWKAELERRAAAQGTDSTNLQHAGSSADGTPPAVGATAGAEQMRKRKRRMYNVAKISVRDLAARPDLANVGALLHLAAHRQIRVTSRTSIQARFDCGTSVRQHLRATEEYLGAPWYDAVLYHPGGDESRVCVGELRAIVRGPTGDAIVLVAMESVPSEPLCPFVSRGCVRLKWRVNDGASDVTLRLVPVHHVKRLAFVVPDFADLAARRGVTEDLPSMEGPLQERLDMRYFLNVFFPWDVK